MNLISSLTSQFKPYLSWNKAHLDVLSILVTAVIKRRTINLTELATAFPGRSETGSCYRRIQRFFQKVVFDDEAVAKLIASLFSPEGSWALSLDRTNWAFGLLKINILCLAINHKGIAIPVLWAFLPKKGATNTQERIDLLERFRAIFPDQPVHQLLADREFKGKRWLAYLKHHQWPFCIRIPVNTLVPNRYRNRQLPVQRIFSLAVGESMAMQKPRRVWGQMVYLAASRSSKDLMVVMCSHNPAEAINDYLQRWQIETLFQVLKSRGFNLEETRLKHCERISKQLAVITIAFCWSYKMGEWVNEKRPIKRKKHGRLAKSLFRVGLDYLQRVLDTVTIWLDEVEEAITILFELQPSGSP